MLATSIRYRLGAMLYIARVGCARYLPLLAGFARCAGRGVLYVIGVT